MSTTTIAAIRDRMITVIRQLTPTVYASDPFVPFENEERAEFESAAANNPDGSVRLFQVRQVGDDDTPEWSDATTEERFVRLRISIAYPAANRWGPDQALDRDDVIASDRDQIERAVGMYGRANFTDPHPDACWRPQPKPLRTTLRAGACDFLVVEQTMSYFRNTSGLVMASPENIVQLTNASGQDVVPGQPVYSSGNGTFALAKADAESTATVIGLVAAPIISGARGPVQLADGITLTTAQWDAVCGTTGGLTANTKYWLSAAAAGLLTSSAPGSGVDVTVISALSTTQARILSMPGVPL